MHKNSGTRKYSKSYTVECIHKIQVHKFYPKLEADIAVRSQESVLQSTGFWKENRTKEKKTKGWERIAKKSSSRCAHWGKHHTSKLRLRYSATNRKGASNLPTFPQFTILHSEVGREDLSCTSENPRFKHFTLTKMRAERLCQYSDEESKQCIQTITKSILNKVRKKKRNNHAYNTASKG